MEKWQSACGEEEKAFMLRFRAYYIRKYFTDLNGRLSKVFWAPLSMLSNVKMKKNFNRESSSSLICALVDWAISMEAHVLESKRAHFSRVSPITV